MSAGQAFAPVRSWMATALKAPKAVIDALERFIADNSVSFREMADIDGHTLIGRDAADRGDPQSITVGGNLEFTGAGGIQRGAITGDVTAAAGSGATTFRNGAALSVLGNATNASATLADIAAASDNQVLRRSGTGLGFGSVNLASSNAVTGILGFANGGTGQSAYTDGQLLIGNTSTGGLTKATLTAGTNVTITNAGGSITIAASGGSGTVSSVGLSAPAIFTVSGSPVTTSGTLTFALNTQSANVVFAGPASGAAAAPTFRALSSADLPLGTNASPGAIRGDGTTISITGGVATAIGTAPSAGVPATIPDLLFWFESDNILGTNGNYVPVMQNRTPWASALSGIAQTGGTMSATLLNGLPVLSGNGTTDVSYGLTNHSGAGPLSGAYKNGFTSFVVFNLASTAAVSTFLAGQTGALQYCAGSGGTKQQLVKDNTVVIGTGTATLSAGTWYQANATYLSSSGAFAFRLNRAADGSGTNIQTITAANSSLLFNDGGLSEYFNGKIAVLITYTRVLSPTEIASVESYLHSKWNV